MRFNKFFGKNLPQEKGLYMSFWCLCLVLVCSLLSACIMTKDPKYKLSYLDSRYHEILTTDVKTLTSSDFDEAYLLSTMYIEKKRLKEARNLLKIVFDQSKTLSSGLAYIDVLNQLGEKKEADDVHKLLAILYKDNEIQDQTKIFKDF